MSALAGCRRAHRPQNSADPHAAAGRLRRTEHVAGAVEAGGGARLRHAPLQQGHLAATGLAGWRVVRARGTGGSVHGLGALSVCVCNNSATDGEREQLPSLLLGVIGGIEASPKTW
jgi:hypothetical protein